MLNVTINMLVSTFTYWFNMQTASLNNDVVSNFELNIYVKRLDNVLYPTPQFPSSTWYLLCVIHIQESSKVTEATHAAGWVTRTTHAAWAAGAAQAASWEFLDRCLVYAWQMLWPLDKMLCAAWQMLDGMLHDQFSSIWHSAQSK